MIRPACGTTIEIIDLTKISKSERRNEASRCGGRECPGQRETNKGVEFRLFLGFDEFPQLVEGRNVEERSLNETEGFQIVSFG